MPTLDQTKYPIQHRVPDVAGRQYPPVIMLHGNFGLGGTIAERLLRFAEEIRDLGYVVAVPRYYPDDQPHGDIDPAPFVPILEAAVAEVCARSDAAPGSIGLIGYSLGGGVALLWMAGAGAGRVGAFVNFFGYAPPDLPAGLKLPPMAIFHNRKDGMVPIDISLKLIETLDPGVEVLLAAYAEEAETPRNHVFKDGGAADRDSRERALDWLQRRLPHTAG